MLIEKITSEDFELMSMLHNPRSATECLFTSKIEKFESLKNWENKDFFYVRPYQVHLQSYEYLLVDDPELSETGYSQCPQEIKGDPETGCKKPQDQAHNSQ